MVDEQELVICSDRMIYVSITQGQVLQDEQETGKKQDIITVYQNRSKKYKDLSLEQFFYCVFVNTTFKKSKNGKLDDNDERDAVANNEHRTYDMTGVKTKTKKALHHLAGQQLVSM